MKEKAKERELRIERIGFGSKHFLVIINDVTVYVSPGKRDGEYKVGKVEKDFLRNDILQLNGIMLEGMIKTINKDLNKEFKTSKELYDFFKDYEKNYPEYFI